jgi:hypothetical protein
VQPFRLTAELVFSSSHSRGAAMERVFRLLTRPLSSARWDAKFGQIVCWLVSMMVLVLGMFKLTRLPLTETELFFGILLVLTVTLLGLLIGLVLPLTSMRKASA